MWPTERLSLTNLSLKQDGQAAGLVDSSADYLSSPSADFSSVFAGRKVLSA